MTEVFRTDRAGRLSRAGRTPAGGARVSARVARTGVQAYRMPDGSTRREYRPPSEVFHPDSIASYIGAPVTIGHPRHGRVTPATYQSDSVGVVTAPKRVADFGGVEWIEVSADLNAQRAVIDVDGGSLVENSVGYTCDFDPTPGIAPDGQKYDGIQRSIRVNHCALLPAGGARAGSGARLLLDGAEVETEQAPAESVDPLAYLAPIFGDAEQAQLDAAQRAFEQEMHLLHGKFKP